MTDLDLDAIRERADSLTDGDSPTYYAGTPTADVYALIAEVERLRKENTNLLGLRNAGFAQASVEHGKWMRLVQRIAQLDYDLERAKQDESIYSIGDVQRRLRALPAEGQ